MVLKFVYKIDASLRFHSEWGAKSGRPHCPAIWTEDCLTLQNELTCKMFLSVEYTDVYTYVAC